ncbi:MAG: ThiF family adenylyltransferase [Kiritimatiellales bacterium]|nr:ThiF family adenylyltransferase [Kiritimatiellales bacterium]
MSKVLIIGAGGVGEVALSYQNLHIHSMGLDAQERV